MTDKRSLEQKAADAEQRLKERIREANEATADLNSVLKQVKDYAPQLVRDLLEEEVVREVGKMQEVIGVKIDESSDAVLRRFDTLAAILLGETKGRREKYHLSIPELVESIVAQRDELETKRGAST
jgi:hypothetical protein